MVTGRMVVELILPIRRPVAIGIMLNFDGDGHGDSVGTCKQALRVAIVSGIKVKSSTKLNDLNDVKKRLWP